MPDFNVIIAHSKDMIKTAKKEKIAYIISDIPGNYGNYALQKDGTYKFEPAKAN